VPFISQESILEVRRAVDIHEVVSSYLPLKRKGNSWWACCPFHEEKSPSFHVLPEKQFFKCFGCQKAGSAIDFVMEYEKVDYPESIRILAQRAGISLRYEGGHGPGIGKDEIFKANEWAAQLFRKLLLTAPEAELARRYLVSRGVNDEISERFRLGYAADSWDHLLRAAHGGGISEKALHAAGLVVERERGGHYDRFRGRLVFPIADPLGRTIGFGARTLKDEEPKYLNTPETAAFSKGRNFFGLHLIKDEMEASRTLYIVEGYFDVMLPFQAGVRGIAATLGTALTRDHLRILRRYVDRVVLVFDGDKAGREASIRGVDILLAENMDLFIAELPAGEDPADCVVNRGPEKLRECLERPTELFEFILKTAESRVDLSTPGGKARVVEETMERLSQVSDEVKRDILLQQLARRFELDPALLRARLRKAASPEPPMPTAPSGRKPAVESAAEELLALLLAEPGHRATVRTILAAEDYPSDQTRRIAQRLYGWEGTVSDFAAVLETPEDRALVAHLATREFAGIPAEERIHGCLDTLQRHRFRRSREAERGQGDPEERLRQVEEARKIRPSDHGLMPGRGEARRRGGH